MKYPIFGRFSYLSLALAVTMVLFLLVSMAFSLMPNCRFVDRREAFVFAEGDRTVMALASGSYVVEGFVTHGCFVLTPAREGAAHGRATWVWPMC